MKCTDGRPPGCSSYVKLLISCSQQKWCRMKLIVVNSYSCLSFGSLNNHNCTQTQHILKKTFSLSLWVVSCNPLLDFFF